MRPADSFISNGLVQMSVRRAFHPMQRRVPARWASVVGAFPGGFVVTP